MDKLKPLQERVSPWMLACFGPEISADKTERNHRFLEEALELVQSTGCTKSEALQLVDYVYDRGVGDPPQEVGGVMITLAALCLAQGLDMQDCGEVELSRIWTKVEKIRAKQATKPKISPLPQHNTRTTPNVQDAAKVLLAHHDARSALTVAICEAEIPPREKIGHLSKTDEAITAALRAIAGDDE